MTLVDLANASATLIYLAAATYILLAYRRQRVPRPVALAGMAAVAIGLHGVGAFASVVAGGYFRFGVLVLPSLFLWVVNLLVLLGGLNRALHSLFVLLFPLSAAAIVAATLAGGPRKPLDPALASHVILALLAYGFFTIATLQAAVLAFQNYRLKHKQATGVVRLLPPLQTMESLMFQLLWWGEGTLSVLIITGLLYTEDLVAQNQAHTLAFSLIAWLIYAVLLWGRYQLGWRGKTAVRWTLGGFITLLLAYFGTQWVYQILLDG